MLASYLVDMFNNLKPMHLVFFGAIVVVIGGVFGAIGSYFHNMRSSAKTDAIINLQNQLTEKSDQLNVKSEQVITTQAELLKYTSGGDSYGEVQLLTMGDGKGGHLYTFYFIKEGKYPLYDVSITTLDLATVDRERIKQNNQHATLQDLEKYITFSLGEVASGKNFAGVFPIRRNIIHKFLFTINARNGHSTQEFHFIVWEGKPITATRIKVHKNEVATTVVDKADAEFPDANDGKIKWE